MGNPWGSGNRRAPRPPGDEMQATDGADPSPGSSPRVSRWTLPFPGAGLPLGLQRGSGTNWPGNARGRADRGSPVITPCATRLR